MHHMERGFSTIKLLFWLVVIFCVGWYGYNVIPVYNAKWKIDGTFEAVTRNMAGESEKDIRKRLPELFKIKYLAYNDVPEEFYDNIEIKAGDGRVEISSHYHVTVWLLGPVKGVNPESDYQARDLQGMDKLRHKARLDFDFEPYAETP